MWALGNAGRGISWLVGYNLYDNLLDENRASVCGDGVEYLRLSDFISVYRCMA